MRIAITGADGQLGQALSAVLSQEYELVRLTHNELELGHPTATHTVMNTSADLVIHAAAYTNVDGCARDPHLAYQINGLGTRSIAQACQQMRVPLIYISTNEVFAGNQRQPYYEYDLPNPVNAYGRSKLAGELAIRELLNRFAIIRVAWLFGGPRNFVRTVLRLAANPPEDGIRMVADEVGSPTYSHDVAQALVRYLKADEPGDAGTYHLVNSGICSRYAFAREILDQSGHGDVPLVPMTLADYRRDSTPPPYSPLANVAGAAIGLELRPWQEALADYLERSRQQEHPAGG